MVIRGLLLAWLFFGGLTFTEQVLGFELETGGHESQNYEHVLSVLEQAIKPAMGITNFATQAVAFIALVITTSRAVVEIQKFRINSIPFVDFTFLDL